jgi:hypothetical protein
MSQYTLKCYGTKNDDIPYKKFILNLINIVLNMTKILAMVGPAQLRAMLHNVKLYLFRRNERRQLKS